MAGILDIIEDASDEWVKPTGHGRKAEPSPYLPAVQESVKRAGDTFAKDGGHVLAFTATVTGKSKDERAKGVEKIVNALRRAGSQHEPPVSVMVQTGDVSAKGEVRVRFRARPKITRQAKDNGKAA